MPQNPPQSILDKLQGLTDERSDLDAKYNTKAATKDALAVAQHNDEVADSDLTAGVSTFESHRDSFLSLVTSTFGSGPPTSAS